MLITCPFCGPRDAAEFTYRGDAEPVQPVMESHQWFHPTLWGYLWTGMTRKVW